MNAALTIHFAPFFTPQALAAFTAVFIALALFALVCFRRSLPWRVFCAAGFLILFLNPTVIEEQREPVEDVAAVIIDRSISQGFGTRSKKTDEALAYIKEQLNGRDNLDVRYNESPARKTALEHETRLFETLDKTFADVPVQRRAGAILITDGQVHDMPAGEEDLLSYGPVHALLSGSRDDKDRRLAIIESPVYGIVGQTVRINYKVEDTDNIENGLATVITQVNDKKPVIDNVPVGTVQTMEITIDRAGQNVINMEASPVENEITLSNNRRPLIINGVRDRLKVLLVSGQPHAGGRTWRSFLTSDPGVDLVHFTILREPHKLDATPQNELSLIAFPFRELFEIKLYDFDLIIFDRYRLNRIMPRYYFSNIAKYVRQGGALMVASGPAFAGEDSIHETALSDVLPAYPVGEIYDRPYRPALTDTGHKHPVTLTLTGANNKQNDNKPAWGQWMRYIAVQPTQGHVLMTGAEDQPLLILNRVGEGRVAQLSSDHIWLWSRGYDGGGPHAELLRRIAHWLMKEPELEENALGVSVYKDKLIIEKRALDPKETIVTIEHPDGKREELTLTPDENGVLESRIQVDQLGIYSIDDGTQKRFAIVGELNPPELSDVITTEEKLEPAVRATQGGTIWLENNTNPAIRFVPKGRDYNGRNWIGLRQNNSYAVSGIEEKPLLPGWLYALMLMALSLAAWWFEGHKKSSAV